MCVIIERNPNVEIDPEKLESAAKVNAHGYGISIIDRGKMETIRNYTEAGNDPKEIQKIFEDAKGYKLFAHLRYSTKGHKNLNNCHPFPIFEDGDYKIMFMHNGTLSSLGDTTRSDSREFAEEYLAPLTRAFYEIEGEGILVDKKYEKIIEHFRNGGSVFTLYDSNGESLKMGKGFDHEGWWSSNEYSFNRSHREPTVPFNSRSGSSSGGTNYYFRGSIAHPIYNETREEWGYWDRGIWIIDIKKSAEHKEKKKKMEDVLSKDEGKVVGSTVTVLFPEKKDEKLADSKGADKSDKEQEEDFLRMECAAIGQAINHARKKNVLAAKHVPPDKRLTFKELADLALLSDVNILTEEEILEMVEKMPLAATILIMDLIAENHILNTVNRVRQAQEAAQGEAEDQEQKKEVING